MNHKVARKEKWFTLLRLSSFTLSKSNAVISIDAVAKNSVDDVAGRISLA